MADRGFECTLSLGGNSVGKGKSVSLKSEMGEIDNTVFDSSGWKDKDLGLGEWSADVPGLFAGDNATQQAIQTAYLARSSLAAQFRTNSGYGFNGTCRIKTIGMEYGVEGGVAFPISLMGTGALVVYDAGS